MRVCDVQPPSNPLSFNPEIVMSQPAAKVDMRQQMPETACWVDAKRKELGKDHVNACIKRALAGEPGQFYAFEDGHALGTPFPATHPIADDQRMAVLLGCSFAGFIALPGGVDGAH